MSSKHSYAQQQRLSALSATGRAVPAHGLVPFAFSQSSIQSYWWPHCAYQTVFALHMFSSAGSNYLESFEYCSSSKCVSKETWEKNLGNREASSESLSKSLNSGLKELANEGPYLQRRNHSSA